MQASSTKGCTLQCILLYSTVEYLYFKPDLQEDIFTVFLAEEHKELTNEGKLEAKRKDEERQQEELTEEPKRYMKKW